MQKAAEASSKQQAAKKQSSKQSNIQPIGLSNSRSYEIFVVQSGMDASSFLFPPTLSAAPGLALAGSAVQAVQGANQRLLG